MSYEGFTLNADTMGTNKTGFTYSSGAPYTGPVARFSTGGGYDMWLNAPYGGGGTIAFRTRNGDAGSNNPWRVILCDSNYTSYAPSLTGGGASGTWNININGTFNSSGRCTSNEWIQFNNHTGLYSPINNAHFYPNNASYGSWRMDGARNGWNGIEFDTGTSLMMNNDSHGFHRNIGGGWRFFNSGGSGYFPGEVQAGYSDQRLKTNLREIGREAIDILSGFTTYRFTWNELSGEVSGGAYKPGKEEIGLIAQHVQKLLPDAVKVNLSGAKLGETGFDYLTINYDRITPLLVGSVNIHEKDIADLKAEVAELRDMVKKLIGESK
jgi:hypothetical protein